ncbi:MAG: glycoside hydrolase family 3 C-terminal domain-containing protein [Bacteroidota bacterium]
MDTYEDTNESFDDRAKDLVSRMSLQEKISQMQRESPAIDHLGIGKYSWGNEGLHGVVAGNDDLTSTVFPQSIGIASSWNPELVKQEATAISDEARALGKKLGNTKFLNFWSPMINMARDPRWGRLQESYGEDPLLVTKICQAFVEGLQGSDERYIKTAATVKHFIANNVDYQRHYGNSEIDEKLLRDYYFPAFKANVQKSNVQIIMSAYNALNEVPCSSNEWLLQQVLRDEWGFDGHVVSDCGAIYNIHANHHYVKTPEEGVAVAVKSGTDLNCGGQYTKFLGTALEQGLLEEKDIDKAVKRLILTRMRLGMFDPPEMLPYSTIQEDIVEQAAHQDLALKAAEESIVLLKNDPLPGEKNNFLPLSKDIQSVAVIGPNADVCVYGNYSGVPSRGITPLEGIQQIVSDDTEVLYAQGSAIHDFRLPPIDSKSFFVSGELKQNGLKAEFFNNMELAGEAVLIRTDTNLVHEWWNEELFPSDLVHSDKFSVRWTGKIVPEESTNYMFSARTTVMSSDLDKGIRIYLDNELVLDQWTSHCGWETGITKKLEAGKAYDFKVEYIEDIDWAAVVIGWKALQATLLEEAVETAKKADAVILVLGSRNDTEGEHLDRQSLDLLPEQEVLLRQVYEANPNTVLTLVNGSPIAVNWADEHLPAILEAWYPGQAEGTAIANVIFGDYNPGGKLPVTFYRSANDIPAFQDYDIRKGKTYMYLKQEPLYEFGHGLSYTEFAITNVSMKQQELSKDGMISISFEIENTGDMEGSEVVQLYVHEQNAYPIPPQKVLKAFERIFLQSGEQRHMSLSIPVTDLATYHLAQQAFAINTGTYDLILGNSSEDVYYQDQFTVTD